MQRTATILLVSALAASASFAQTTRPAPRLTFDRIGLGDVIDAFAEATKANFTVDWKLLEAAGIDKSTPITLNLRNVTVRTALKKALDSAGPGLLTFYTEGNIIHITTQEAADSRLLTRVYDVGDMLMDIPDFQGPELSLENQNSNNQARGGSQGAGAGQAAGGGGGNLFGGGGTGNNQPNRRTRAETADGLVTTIQTTIRPEVWDINGGKSRIRLSGSRMIVTAPLSVHEQLAGR